MSTNNLRASADDGQTADVSTRLPASPPDRQMMAHAFAAACLVALAISAQTYLAMRNHGHSFWRMFGWQLASWTFWVLFTPTVARMGGSLSGAKPVDLARLLRIGMVATMLIVSHTVLAAQLAVWFQPYLPSGSNDFRDALDTLFRSQLVTDLLAFTTLLFIGSTLAITSRARQLALRESQLEAALARATLEALRLEIQPHFLFNTLHSIAALIRIKANGKALEMLLGLSELMRTTLDRAPAHETSLASEVEFVTRYIDLQRTRFGDQLQVRYTVDPACRPCAVPTFLLQPLVENAFRHGIGRKAGPSHLELGATTDDEGLRLWVSDSGAGLPAGFSLERDAGTGLSNIRVRLKHLYGSEAHLALAARPGGGTLATVRLPRVEYHHPAEGAA